MSMGVIAGVSAAVIGAGASIYSGNKAASAAKRAGWEAAEMAEDQLQFEQAKYADWKETYGDVEQNLSNYYNQLSPEYYATLGVQQFREEQQTTLNNLRESFAQRGIYDSGVSAALEKDVALSEAEGVAKIRATAPSMAAEEQRGFLQVGLGQNPGSSLSQTLANQSSQASATANAAAQASGVATANAVQAVGGAIQTGLDAYSQYKSTTPATVTPTAPANLGYTDYSGYA